MLIKEGRFAFLAACIGLSATAASAQDERETWQRAIGKVSASAAEYKAYSSAILGTTWVGVGFVSWKADEHRCAILGRMLGKIEEVKVIETFDYPPMDSTSDPHDLLMFSVSLENWVGAAEWALGAEEHTRINTWNLECAGRYGIPLSAMMESSRPEAEFRIVDGDFYIYGDIDPGFYERYEAAIENQPEVRRIWVGSGGGSVIDAIQTGIDIRKRGLETNLHGNCYSACPLVFLGGTRRTMWASPARLGFHQAYRGNGEAIPADDKVYGLIANYSYAMGADAQTILSWMWSAGPGEMYEPPVGELCAPAVATFVQRVCSAP